MPRSTAICPAPDGVLCNAVSASRDQLSVNLGYDAAKLPPEKAALVADAFRNLVTAAAGLRTGSAAAFPRRRGA
jgi:hypothetical protein